MAKSINNFVAVGNLTADPESFSTQSGGSVVKFSIAINNSVSDGQGGWVDDPCFIECVTFISPEGKGIGKVVLDYLSKGKKVAIVARLKLERWNDQQTNSPRQKHVLIVEELNLLSPKDDDGNQGSQGGNQNYNQGNQGNQNRGNQGNQGNQNRGNQQGGNQNRGNQNRGNQQANNQNRGNQGNQGNQNRGNGNWGGGGGFQGNQGHQGNHQGNNNDPYNDGAGGDDIPF